MLVGGYAGPVAASRDEIVGFCDELLEIDGWEDFGPNGMQVPGTENVELVVTGVDANLALFQEAEAAGADLVMTHHGTLWDSGTRALNEPLAARLKVLLGAGITMCAYHLPLDAHPEIGNNALICDRLAIGNREPFGSFKGNPIGFCGELAEAVSAEQLIANVEEMTGRDAMYFPGGPAEVSRIGVVSGGGGDTLDEAGSRGLHALITGEPEEPSPADAREHGIHFIAGGHYATETFGITALGDRVAERFGVEHRFIDVPNPV
jgi:dinuclear metal center YbgI/SA1388 family protein